MTSSAAPLSSQVFRATGWTAGSFASSVLAQFVQMIILARAFGAAGLGLVAVVTLTSAYVDIFLNSGVSQAIIQRRRVTRPELESLYWVNLALAAIIAAVVFFAGGLISSLVNAPAAGGLLQVTSLVFVLNSHAMVPRAVLEKDLQFRPLAVSDVIANALLITGTAVLVLLGVGPVAAAWALVLAALGRSIAVTVATRTQFRPRLRFAFGETRRFLSFGGIQMLDSTINFAAANAATLTLGRFIGTAAMGGFNLVFNLAVNLPARINPVLTRVMFPALSLIQDDLPRVSRAYLRATSAVGLVNVPGLLLLAVVAPEFVETFFGAELSWTARLLVPLCLVGVLRALGNPVGPLLMATDNNRLGLGINVLQSVITIPVIVLGAYRWGTTGAAYALLAASVINVLVASAAVQRAIGIPVRAFLRVCLAPVLLSVPMAVAVLLVKAVLPAGWPVPLRFVLLTLVGGAVLARTAWLSRYPLITDLRHWLATRVRFPWAEVTDAVAVLPPADESFDGTGGAIAQWIASTYPASSHDHTVFTARGRTSRLAPDRVNRSPVVHGLTSVLDLAAGAVSRVTGGSRGRILTRLLLGGRLWIWLISRRVGTYAVVHVHNKPMYAVWLRRFGYRGRVVVHMHNDLADHVAAADLEQVRADVDLWIFCSRYLADRARHEFGIENGQVLHNGVELPVSPADSAVRSMQHLVYAGRVIPEKGALDAVDICAELNRQGYRTTLTIVGGPGIGAELVQSDYYAHVRRRADDVNLAAGEPLVSMLGFVADRGRLLAELGRAGAFIYPCHWDEPFGMVLVEALSVGTPVVSYRRGGIPEVVDDGVTGHLVEDGEAMLAAIHRLRIPSAWASMSASGAAAVRSRFSWPSIARRLDVLLAVPPHGDRTIELPRSTSEALR